jgi:hypothetical protein
MLHGFSVIDLRIFEQAVRRRACSSSGDEDAAKTILDSKSRTTLKSPTMNRTASPLIKTQVTNTRINDGPMFNGRVRLDVNVYSKRGACTRLT